MKTKYPANAWYVAAWSEEVTAEQAFAISILNEPLAIFRTASKGLVVLEDRCVHRLAPLSKGRCEGDNIRCMYHGLLYNSAGKCIEIPGQEQIPDKAKVRSYPVQERHSWIWVWMGDPALADETLIPPAIGPDNPDFILGHGQLDYKAEARLINDNLLDFSHLAYVHANSFGASTTFATQQSKLTPLERGVRFQRWICDEPGMRARSDGKNQDGWMTYDFLVPGVLLMATASFAVGTAQEFDFGEPDYDKVTAGWTFTSQAVTPMTEQTSRYFFCWGPHRKHGDEKLRDVLMGIADQAFNEDKVIIEAQQEIMNQTPDVQIMPIISDNGVTIYNRLVRSLIMNS